MIVRASSADWRCWASKSDGTYFASITGVIGNTFMSRTAPPDAFASDTAVSIADLARSVSARSTGTRIFLNIVLPPSHVSTRLNVIRGLDPRIHPLCKSVFRAMDRRVNPRIKSGDGDDGSGERGY